MKILVLGGSGMLGHKLVQVLAAESDLEVHASVRTMPAIPTESATYHPEIVIAPGSSSVTELLATIQPDITINAIGAIKQKDLYAHLEETLYVNALLPHLLAFGNPNPDGRVIHFSTDCVFDGTRGWYRENDAPDADDLYGRSKAEGELTYANHLTIRTSIIGFELNGFLGLVSWLLKQKRGSTLPGFSRAIYSGLPTATLSRTVLELIRHHRGLAGLYHVASEPISKYRLLTMLNEALDLGHTIIDDPSFVMDRSLDDTKFRNATGLPRPAWTDLIEEMLADFSTFPYADIYQLSR